jgi:hypothetical protein
LRLGEATDLISSEVRRPCRGLPGSGITLLPAGL